LNVFPEDSQLLKNLVNATDHPKWQMVKYGRDMIRKLIRKEHYRTIFTALIPELNQKEQIELQRLLDEK
jgi:aminopeptidase N